MLWQRSSQQAVRSVAGFMLFQYDKAVYNTAMAGRSRWRDLPIFPWLAALVSLIVVLMFTGFALLGLRAVHISTNRILEEKLVLTEMAARQVEALVQQAFNELLKATTFAPFDPAAVDLGSEYHMLAHSYGRIGTMTLGVYFLDRQGTVVLAEPPETTSAEAVLQPIRNSFTQPGGRMVSEPFVEPRTGRPAVAVTIAVRGKDREISSYLSGLIDLSGPLITGSLENALKLGHTGHAELVTAEGIVIASTDPGYFLHPGEHRSFYRTNLTGQRTKVIETVPYELNGVPTQEKHIMAVVPLSVGNWGLALGGNETETMAPVTSLRRNLLLSGLVMLAVTLGITLWGTRRIVRPVLLLTRRARAMAEGDLITPVEINGGGELGVLAKVFNEMRKHLLEARERLTQSNLELEEKVRQRSQELAKLQAQVELERLKVEFISQVSHEFRTPLGLIKGYITTLLRRDVSPDEETRREFLTITREETEKLEELVETLMDNSRIRTGTFAVNKEGVDLESLLQRVTERAEARAERHTILCRKTISLPAVWADAHRLEQVFDNLLDNALKYSRGGAVTIDAQVQDGKVHFAVSDEGDGIPTEEIAHIFDVFYRVNNPAAAKTKGSGLGLAICKGIVEAHGGHIWAESILEKGSCFHFTLPLEETDDENPGSDS